MDGQTDRRTDGQTDRNFVEILGKLCFARLKLNLKTEDRFKLKTKLGYRTQRSQMRRRNSECECEVKNKTLHFDNATVSINNEA